MFVLKFSASNSGSWLKHNVKSIAAQNSGVQIADRKCWSFTETKLAEYCVKQILRRRFSDDFSDGGGGDSQVHRDEFEAQISFQRGDGALDGASSPTQSVLVAGVDHCFEHFGADFAGPHFCFDGISQRLDSFSADAANIDGGEAWREFQLARQIDFVADDDSFFSIELGQ